MASKRRLRRRSCESKNRYTNQQAVLDSLGKLRRLGRVDSRVTAYPCKFCGGYHLGHRTIRAIRAQALDKGA